jgi:hypothetical protein
MFLVRNVNFNREVQTIVNVPSLRRARVTHIKRLSCAFNLTATLNANQFDAKKAPITLMNQRRHPSSRRPLC